MRERYRSFLSALHVDIANGTLAPNTTWAPQEGDRFPDAGDISYQAHLMIKDPFATGIAFISAGADTIEAHAEGFASVEEGIHAFQAWKSAGAKKLGIVLTVQTPIEAAEPYFKIVDYVRLMTIPRIGTQGIPFYENSADRISSFHTRYPGTTIAIDGGISEKNIQELARAGASSFTAGSLIAKSENPEETYHRLIALAQSAV